MSNLSLRFWKWASLKFQSRAGGAVTAMGVTADLIKVMDRLSYIDPRLCI